MTEEIIGIGVNVNGGTTAAGEIGKVGDALGAMGDKAIVAADGLDKVAAANDRVSASMKVGGRNIIVMRDAEDTLNAVMGKTTSVMDSAAAATDRYSAAADTAAVSAERLMASQEAMAAKQAEIAINTQVANDALGKTYVGMSKLEQLGTPAIMKAATWSILGVGGVAYEGIKQYMNFNKLITQTITQAGVSPSNMGALTTMAETISKMTGVNLNDVANNIYRVASGTASWNAGLGSTMKQLQDITTSVTKLQVLGNVPAGAASEQAARVITALVNSNIVGVGNSSDKAAALINAAVGSGDMRLADLVPGIGRGVLQSAKANGVSAKDMLAWIALQTSMGTTASVAGNYVKTGINLLANPSAQGVLAESMIGIKPGEMQGIIAGPGGLQAAVSVFNEAVKKLTISSNFVGYRTSTGNARAGGTGEAAALNKLQTWMVGEMPAVVLKQWEHGGSAASGGLTPANLQWITDLIMTKAFGGSKQFATMAAILKNPQLLAGIETSIGNKSSVASMNAAYAIASNTPSQRFHKDLAAIQVDLVNAGKALYPATIKLVDGFTWLFSHITSWKPALLEIGAAMTAVVAVAAAVKISQLGTGAMAMYGGLLTKMNPSGTSGGYFRAAYQAKTAGTIADLGAAIRATGAEETIAIKDGDAGITGAVREGATETVDALRGVQATLAEGLGVRNVGSLTGAASKIQSTGIMGNGENIAGFNKGLADLNKNGAGILPMPVQAGEYGPRSPAQRLWMENKATAAMMASAPGSAAFQAEMAARNSGVLGARDLQNTFVPPFVIPEAAATEATTIAKTGSSVLSGIKGLGVGALGLVGGPIGLAMIASTVLPLAVPFMMKGISAMSHWFGGAQNANSIALSSISHPLVQTASQYTSTIDSYKKQIAQLNNQGYNPLTATAAETAQWQNLHMKLNTAQGGLAGLNPAQQMAQIKNAWAISNNAGIANLLSDTAAGGQYNFGKSFNMSLNSMPAYMMGSIMSGLSGDVNALGNIPGAKQLREEIAGATGKGKNYISLSGLTPGQLTTKINAQVAALLSSNQGLLATPEGQAALVGNKVVKDYAGYIAAQGTISTQANYGNLAQSLTLSGLNNSNSAQREMSAQNIAAKLVGLAQSDLIRAGQQGSDAGARNLYLAASKKAAAEAIAFEQLHTEMINKLDGQKIDKGSIKALALEITNQQRQLYKDLKLTGGDIGMAFSAALGVSGATLAKIVNNANATTGARK